METLIQTGLAQLGQAGRVPENAAALLARYGELLVEKNRVMNLTAITQPRDAASEAENFVLLPISLALSRRASSSFPAAPDTAAIWLMAESKSEATFTAAAESPPTAAVTGITLPTWTSQPTSQI